MATCKDCLHYDACYIVTVYGDDDNENCKQFKNKADVAPKSKVAREIFEEIEKIRMMERCFQKVGVCYDTASEYEELKKKYTEGEK